MGNYTLIHSEELQWAHGVARLLTSDMSGSLMLWHPVLGRLLVAHQKHPHGTLSLIVAFAPTPMTFPLWVLGLEGETYTYSSGSPTMLHTPVMNWITFYPEVIQFSNRIGFLEVLKH